MTPLPLAAVAIAVFVVVYFFIATEKINKTVAALTGAGIVLVVGGFFGDKGLHSTNAFFSRETGIDWDVIFLLFGMMVIVSILRKTGVFEYIAIVAVKRAGGSPLRIMILLVLLTALASAGLDNVTTVLLIAPVTLLVCDRLAVNPIPFLLAEVFASNIGGAATLIGDPPNIIIGTKAVVGGKTGLAFDAFLAHMTPIVVVLVAVLVLLLPMLFRGELRTDPERVASVMKLNEKEAIADRRLLAKSLAVLVAVLAGFVLHITDPSLTALLGAGVLVLISDVKPKDYLTSVEWDTLLFFAGLFVLVGALVHTGVIATLGKALSHATGGNALLAVMLILIVSALLSGVVDNIPYVATMTPLVGQLVGTIANPVHQEALWWSLALGADLGGNMTAIGASANVVVLGIARSAGYEISFWEFTKKGLIVTAITVALCVPYVYLRYFLAA